MNANQKRRRYHWAWLTVASGLASCGVGGGDDDDDPISARGRSPEIVATRTRIESPNTGTELRRLDRFGLAAAKILDRTGVESGVRVAALDGNRLLFARERRFGNPTSTELFVATLDGSVAESRLTNDSFVDESPCWSPDNEAVLFASTRFSTDSSRRLCSFDLDDPRLIRALADDGTDQQQPDWSAAIDRIVFSGAPDADATPRRLYLVDPAGGTPIPLTDGGLGRGDGDFDPAFSPDGTQIVFSRHVGEGTGELTAVRQLMVLDVATRMLTHITPTTTLTEDRYPRWSPDGAVLLFARNDPLAGMPGLRLYSVASDGRDPRLLVADKRYEFRSFDPLPTFGAAANDRDAIDWVDVELDTARLTTGVGRAILGDRQSLYERDNDPIGLRTGSSSNREVAALLVDFDLPVDDPLDAVAIEFGVVATIDPVIEDAILRLAVHNRVEDRNDTVLEVTPTEARLTNYTFTLQSLAHVSSRSTSRISIIAELPRDADADLLIDQLRVRVARRRAP